MAKLFSRQQIFLFLLTICFVITFSSVTHARSPQALVEEGKTYYEKGSLTEAVEVLEKAVSLWEAEENWKSMAITLTNLGRVQLAIGADQKALATWERAIDLYEDYLKEPQAITRLHLYSAEALESSGFYLSACDRLTKALTVNPELCQERSLQSEDLKISNSQQKSAWESLADLFRKMGRLEESEVILSQLLTQASSEVQKDTIRLDLGNTQKAFADRERDRAAPIPFDIVPWGCEVTPIPETAQNYYQQALKNYQQTARSISPSLRTKAQLNGLNLLATTGNAIDPSFSPHLDLSTLPPGRSRIYAQILATKTQFCINQHQNQPQNWSGLSDELENAITTAQQINDRVAESYAIGNLGSLYESHQGEQWQQEALKLTDRALFLGQSVQAKDNVYQWHWQRGRLLNQLGEKTEAIEAYEAAIKTLETIRSDLGNIDADVQFSFRNQVEPVYRELVRLLLASIENNATTEEVQDKLTRSLYYMESLRLVQLENFLRCNLETPEGMTAANLANQPQPVETLRDRIETILEADPNTALIYPILLEDKITVLLKQPGQPFRYHTTEFVSDTATIDQTLNTLQTYLKTDPSRRNDIRQLSSQVYQWLIAPFAAELEVGKNREESHVKRLTFVLDGALRNIPMNLLFDAEREHYLIERYSSSIAPSLQLLDTQPHDQLRSALVSGLSQKREIDGQMFAPLNQVPEELANIASLLSSEQLLNQEFIRSQVQQKLKQNPYEIFHVATHGNFSSDPKETYILLYDQKLLVREFNQLFRANNPLELLVLSACETATGDRRAALGLAGMALRGGAKSTLSTLWQVDDASTSTVMSTFYQELANHPQLPKAEALRNAQLKLWKTNPEWQLPFFWSSYVLVGNWL